VITSARKEDLDLSALDVTFERYQFSPKPALTGTGKTEWDGQTRTGVNATAKDREKHSFSAITDGSVRWLSSTGRSFVGICNSFIWEFTGDKAHPAANCS